MENNKKYIIILICIIALMIFGGGYLAGYKYSVANNMPSIITDTVDVVHVKQDSIFLTDTVKINRTRHIRDSVYIPNPLDSVIYKDYAKLSDSLKMLNIDRFVILDTIVKQDTINIKCNSIKSIISLAYRPQPRFDTIRYVTKTITIPSDNWSWKAFGAGNLVGIGVTTILIKAIK